METYNYREVITDDVRNYWSENAWRYKGFDRKDVEERLHDDLWAEDSVTGNASGSYTFNAYKAEEYICHNLDLLAEACDEFGCDTDILKDGAETCDVKIRCYLLRECIGNVMDEAEEEGFFDDEDEEEEDTEEE